MSDNKEYSKLTLEALLIEEKKIKKKEFISALVTGILIGVMVYGVAKNGFGFIYIFIPLFLIYVNFKNSQKLKIDLKLIQTEINIKNTK